MHARYASTCAASSAWTACNASSTTATDARQRRNKALAGRFACGGWNSGALCWPESDLIRLEGIETPGESARFTRANGGAGMAIIEAAYPTARVLPSGWRNEVLRVPFAHFLDT